MRPIALLSDFGLADPYVGQMKGVILGINPEARIVDVTHEVPAGDVLAGAFAIGSAWRAFPQGTVHLAVVDPGVGGTRKPLAISAAGHSFIGPDNGLFTHVLEEAGESFEAYELRCDFRPEEMVSATFHGRDIFAPAAAYLAMGKPLDFLGKPLSGRPVSLDIPPVSREGDSILGQVIHVDRFGNAVTNIRRKDVEETHGFKVEAAGMALPLGRTYGDVPEGRCLGLWGSSRRLEVSCNRGNAARVLGLSRGSRVVLRG